jgi:flavin reductase (DIM6/NTAB) family NADH-FMN oxidoreductase RutF
MVGLNKIHHTPKGIMENKTFSLNIPSSDQVIETDYCGLVSGKTTDKSNIFTTFYGELETAPMIEECPINCECKLVDKNEFTQCIVYFGKVQRVYANEKKFDITKVNPMFFSGLETKYRTIGGSESLGQCYKIGWSYKKAQLHKKNKV